MHVEGAPTVPDGFFDHCQKHDIPVLGICYGMQLLVQRLGGKVEQATTAEYGRMPVHTVSDSLLYKGETETSQQVWMSHGDEATALPPGFRCVGKSDAGAVVAIEDPARKLFGLQYHPEVTHSERGFETIKRFLFDIAGLTAGWSMQNVLDEQIALVKEKVGPDAHVICALSGGVDSAVAATLVHRAIGDRLHCCFVDNGLLRYKEQERVMKMFKDHLHLPVTCVDDSERLLAKLKGITDPEKKRKCIGAQFIEVFKEYKAEVEAKTGCEAHVPCARHLVPRRHRILPPTRQRPGAGLSQSPHSASLIAIPRLTLCCARNTRTRSRATTTWAVCRKSWVSVSYTHLTLPTN